ncbi:hypothetical protein SEA_PUPPER_193 [Gordonia phage Pupper]|uniref:Uncharacterized protein n=1 Tax=Gordonia phage Pupper TaxID=2571249 RepID=A0A4Y6ESD4_9CAUD|nr:hypothetical protein KHQ83_gp084 [Gordonia phage Pupper]QDF18679.1 hypothetical protein SEA_PUPPER_193 [Gordonia phage Pupper]QDF18911.1 hypothetical protein SEA_SCENTAE_192 [Gordonia phage SCentae]
MANNTTFATKYREAADALLDVLAEPTAEAFQNAAQLAIGLKIWATGITENTLSAALHTAVLTAAREHQYNGAL